VGRSLALGSNIVDPVFDRIVDKPDIGEPESKSGVDNHSS
jgi:hypothetical protein